MAVWEYATLRMQETYKDGKWDHRDFTFNGPEGTTEPFQGSSSVPILNKLGKDGWEAYHVETINQVYYNQIGNYTYPTATPVERVIWLKRPAK